MSKLITDYSKNTKIEDKKMTWEGRAASVSKEKMAFKWKLFSKTAK